MVWTIIDDTTDDDNCVDSKTYVSTSTTDDNNVVDSKTYVSASTTENLSELLKEYTNIIKGMTPDEVKDSVNITTEKSPLTPEEQQRIDTENFERAMKSVK